MGYGIKLKKPAYTKDTRLYTLKNIPEVLIPVGDSHTVTVNNGDRVKIGTMLGVSLTSETPLLSSISGTVGGIFTIGSREYVRIVNDNKYELSDTVSPCPKRLSEMSREEMVERIRVCGIPEWKQIAKAKGIVRFAVNCADTDPYNNASKCIIKNKSRELIGGAKIIMKLLSVRLCEFLIEKNETNAINTLVDSIGDSRLFDIVELTPRYPYGQSSHILTQLPYSESLEEDELFVLPADVVCAVYTAFAKGLPDVRRAVSVGGSASYADGTYLLPLGTPVKYLADSVTDAGEGEEHFTIIKNGTMTGGRATSEDAVITRSTHTLTFIKDSELSQRVDACIGCARCDSVCPQGLLPSLFMERQSTDHDKALSLSGMNKCIECGACSYVCPANLPIHEIALSGACAPKPNEYRKKRTVKRAPFISSPDSVTTINLDILTCLVMLVAWSACVFGSRAILISLICAASAVACDILYALLTRSSVRSVFDLGSVVCGLATALTMTVRVPLYLCALASAIAIIIIRGAFGGRSKNIIHSVFGARIIISLLWHEPFVLPARNYTLFDRIIGNTAGGLGEISAILLIVCALYLIIRRILPIIPTITALSTFCIITFITSEVGIAANSVSIALLGSAILYVCLLSSSEYSALPKGAIGRIAYGIICGGISALILRYTDYEGAYISAVMASLLTVPLFSRIREADAAYTDGEEKPEPEVDLEAIFGSDESDTNKQEQFPLFSNESSTPAQPQKQEANAAKPEAEESHPSDKIPEPQQKHPSPSPADEKRFDTESFHIESAEELLSILSAELGMGVDNDRPAQATASSEHNGKSDPDFSTAVFDRLYDEINLDSTPEK